MLGWFDIKHHLLYETNYLALLSEDMQQQDQRIQNFVEFLQVLLQKKMFLKLFKELEFHKGMCVNKDSCTEVTLCKKKLEDMRFVEIRDKTQSIIGMIGEMVKEEKALVKPKF